MAVHLRCNLKEQVSSSYAQLVLFIVERLTLNAFFYKIWNPPFRGDKASHENVDNVTEMSKTEKKEARDAKDKDAKENYASRGKLCKHILFPAKVTQAKKKPKSLTFLILFVAVGNFLLDVSIYGRWIDDIWNHPLKPAKAAWLDDTDTMRDSGNSLKLKVLLLFLMIVVSFKVQSFLVSIYHTRERTLIDYSFYRIDLVRGHFYAYIQKMATIAYVVVTIVGWRIFDDNSYSMPCMSIPPASGSNCRSKTSKLCTS